MPGLAYSPYIPAPPGGGLHRGPGSTPGYVPPVSDADVRSKRLAEEEQQRQAERTRQEAETAAGVEATRTRTAADVAGQNQRWNQQAVAGNQRYIDSLMGRFGMGGGGSSSSSGSALSPADQAASAASFARAKDRQAETIGASMGALKNAMSARGLAGSGMEQQSMADIVGGGAANLGEFERERALSEVQQRQESARLASSTRAQDYGFLSSLMSLMNAGVRY